MEYENKSILNNIPMKETGWDLCSKEASEPLKLAVVSACPRCGAPIYGPKQLPQGMVMMSAVQYSCDCRHGCCGGSCQ